MVLYDAERKQVIDRDCVTTDLATIDPTLNRELSSSRCEPVVSRANGDAARYSIVGKLRKVTTPFPVLSEGSAGANREALQ